MGPHVDALWGSAWRAASTVFVTHGAPRTGIELTVLETFWPCSLDFHHVGVTVDRRVGAAVAGILPHDLLVLGGSRRYDQEHVLARCDAEFHFSVSSTLQGAVACRGEVRVGGHETPAPTRIRAVLRHPTELDTHSSSAGFGEETHDIVPPTLRCPVVRRLKSTVCRPVVVLRFKSSQTQSPIGAPGGVDEGTIGAAVGAAG